MSSSVFDFDELPESLDIKVIPKAKCERLKKELRADGTVLYKIYVTVVPENGKANEAVLKLLAKELKLPKSALVITQGHTSPQKRIKISR